MGTEIFKVQNVKCGGCVKAIIDGLTALPQVEEVNVTVEDGRVTVSGDGISRPALAGKLAELGYPETETG